MKFFYTVFLNLLAWHHQSSIEYFQEECLAYRKRPIELYYLNQSIQNHQKNLEKIEKKLDSLKNKSTNKANSSKRV